MDYIDFKIIMPPILKKKRQKTTPYSQLGETEDDFLIGNTGKTLRRQLKLIDEVKMLILIM